MYSSYGCPQQKVLVCTRGVPVHRPRESQTRGIILNWYLGVWKKYAVFNGRSRRSEFWYFQLFNIIAFIVLGLLFRASSVFEILAIIYYLGVLIPSFAVAVRRLHDTDRTGWWILLGLVPLIGGIVLLIFYLENSKPGDNQYGQNPKVGPALA